MESYSPSIWNNPGKSSAEYIHNCDRGSTYRHYGKCKCWKGSLGIIQCYKWGQARLCTGPHAPLHLPISNAPRGFLSNRAVHLHIRSRGMNRVQTTCEKPACLHDATSAFDHEDNLDGQSDKQGHTRTHMTAIYGRSSDQKESLVVWTPHEDVTRQATKADSLISSVFWS